MPAILIEVCFVDSEADAEIYNDNFLNICDAIADVLGDEGDIAGETPPPSSQALFEATGTCSSFGGPDDEGVSPSEELAFIHEMDQAPHLFLPYQPEGTSGLARRLNPYVHYVACRWDYDVTSREMLTDKVALVRAPATGIALTAFPADWGPNAEHRARRRPVAGADGRSRHRDRRRSGGQVSGFDIIAKRLRVVAAERAMKTTSLSASGARSHVVSAFSRRSAR